jgi:hypothetical protein
LSRRWQLHLAAVIALTVVLYPALRNLDLIPIDRLMSTLEKIAPERAQSLSVRFDNERLLLAHAGDKPLLGWGGWARWRVYDPQTGDDITVSDGLWVIIFAESGWVGYISKFGLMALPIWLLWRRRARDDLSLESCALAMILAINMVDMLPNGGMTPLTWLIAGALLGRVEQLDRIAAVATVGRRGRGSGTPDLEVSSAPGTRQGRGSRHAPGGRGVPKPDLARPPTGPSTDPRPVRPPSPARAAPGRTAPTRPVRPRRPDNS